MSEKRSKFLEGLKYRLEGKSRKEQDSEKSLANFVEAAQEFAIELESCQKNVNEENLYNMFVERKYNGKYDIFKLDQDEVGIKLAIEIVMREKREQAKEGR